MARRETWLNSFCLIGLCSAQTDPSLVSGHSLVSLLPAF